MKVEISLPYGDKSIQVEIPSRNLLSILEPKDLPSVQNEKSEVTRALKNLIATPKLADMVTQGDKVVIISDDNTRITPTQLIVPTLLDMLNEVGVKDEDIKIIVALGTHRPMTRSEFRQKFGDQVLERVEVENHEFADRSKLVELGVTPNGSPISINKEVVEADFKVGIGNIVPHFICGWAGGAKIIQPGVSGEETTAATHLLCVRMGRPLLGSVENAVKREMELIAQKVGLDMIVNTVLNRAGRIVKVVAGDVIKAAREGINVAKSIYFAKTPAKADIVLASSHPCDLDFWQAHKTLFSADLAVRDGGTIIIVTPCKEGISRMHPEILEIGNLTIEEVDRKLRKGEIKDQIGGSFAIAWGLIKKRAKVIMVSEGIPAQDAFQLGFDYADTVDLALDRAFRRHGKNAKVTVLTHAPDIVPVITESK
ncbi:nickel-dependent lactate racemase [Candidatus Bathyarchaeota archaeon]|nr:nickel-dependent lactate racemase [Candidatus Bathyarchaeota archaeon]